MRLGRLTRHADLSPTLAALTGHRVLGEAPALMGKDVREVEQQGKDRVHAIRCWRNTSCAALIEWPMKYVHFYGSRPDEVYDLARDPHEREDVAAEHAEESARWRKRLYEELEAARSAHGQ